MAFYLVTRRKYQCRHAKSRNAENEELKPDNKSGNILNSQKTGGGICELPRRCVGAYPFVKRGKELDVGLELFSSFFKCLEIWKEKRGMKKLFHRELAKL